MTLKAADYEPDPDPVGFILGEIRNLSHRNRLKLWEILRELYPHSVDDTEPSPEEVWQDPANRFGKKEILLLEFMYEAGEANQNEVLKHLWPDLYSNKIDVKMRLRQRLRQLERRVRRKLEILKSDWRLRRSPPAWLVFHHDAPEDD